VLILLLSTLALILLPKIPFFDKFVDPIMDWDFTDYAYDDFDSTEVDDDSTLVIVNIGALDRAGIAYLIERINEHKPIGIGINILFKGHEDSISDAHLKQALLATSNLILVQGGSKADYIIPERAIESFSYLDPDNLAVVRDFVPRISQNDTLFWHISVELAALIEPEVKKILMQRNRPYEYEFIRFKRRQQDYIVLEHTANLEVVRNKLVLIGHLGQTIDSPFINEKIYNTPLKNQVKGDQSQAMHGEIIFANAISMMLSDDYINSSVKLDFLFTLVVSYLLTLLFMYVIHKTGHYLLFARILSLLLIVLIIASSLHIFTTYQFKLDVTVIILFLLFVPDGYEFYNRYFEQNINQLSKKSRKIVFYVFIITLIVAVLSILSGKLFGSQFGVIFLCYYVGLAVALIFKTRKAGTN